MCTCLKRDAASRVAGVWSRRVVLFVTTQKADFQNQVLSHLYSGGGKSNTGCTFLISLTLWRHIVFLENIGRMQTFSKNLSVVGSNSVQKYCIDFFFPQYGPLKSAAHIVMQKKKKTSKTNNDENTPIAAHQLQHFCFRLSNNKKEKKMALLRKESKCEPTRAAL